MVGIAGPFTPASAQQSSTGSPEVPVHMVVTVKPQHGNQVPVVGRDDVKVYQGKTTEQVTSWVPMQGNRAGLQLFILIDDTARNTLALQFKSLAEFVNEQPASTAIAVGYMRNGMVVTTQELTTDHASVVNAFRLPLGPSVGFTSPYLALSDLMKKWPATNDRREVLMITSGIDPLGGGWSNNPYNNPYLDAAVDNAQRGGFIVYSIYTPSEGFAERGFTRTAFAQNGLELLSEKTGGATYYIGFGMPVDFTPYLQDVTNRLKHQYEVTFLAKAGKKPVLQPVKVKTEVPNTGLVAAQDGYVGAGS